MKTIQEIDAEIRRLVPRMMEWNCPYCGSSEFPYEGSCVNCNCISHFVKTIDLEAVLEVLSFVEEKKERENYEKVLRWDKKIMFRKDFLVIASNNDYGRVEHFDDSLSVRWEYGKPFSQQSPEVHEFVANILFNGK